MANPVEQASHQVGNTRKVKNGETRKTSGKRGGEANQSLTDTVLDTKTQTNVCDDTGTLGSTLQERQVGLRGSRTSSGKLRRLTGHVGVNHAGHTNRLSSGGLAATTEELDEVVRDIQKVGQEGEVDHTIETVIDVIKGLGDSVTDTALDTKTKSDISNDSGALVETGLLVAGGSNTRCNGSSGGSLGENGDGRAGGNHGGGDPTNGHLRLRGETLLFQGAEHGVFAVELIDSQALQALLLVSVWFVRFLLVLRFRVLCRVVYRRRWVCER